MTTLFLIRHAEVALPYHRVFGGSRIDMELSTAGQAQAAALAEWLRQFRLDAVAASPMRRVRETIAPSQDFLPSPVSWDSGFREVDFGDWTGLGWDDVLQRFGVSAYDWLAVIEAGAVPGGESHAEIRDRVLVALRPFLDRWSGRTVALFAHGGIIRVILAWLLEIPLPLTTHLDIDYASVTRVHLNVPKGDVTRHEIHLLNFAPWRDLPAHR